MPPTELIVRLRSYAIAEGLSPSYCVAFRQAADEIERLRGAARLALTEMCNTVAPRNSFTDAVDALDAALAESP